MSGSQKVFSLSHLSEIEMVDRSMKKIPATVYRSSIDEAMKHILSELKALIHGEVDVPSSLHMVEMIDQSMFLPKLTNNRSFLIYTGKGIFHEVMTYNFMALLAAGGVKKKDILNHLDKWISVSPRELSSIHNVQSIVFKYDHLATITIHNLRGGRFEATVVDGDKRNTLQSKEGETATGLLAAIEQYHDTQEVDQAYALYLHDILGLSPKEISGKGRLSLFERDMGI